MHRHTATRAGSPRAPCSKRPSADDRHRRPSTSDGLCVLDFDRHSRSNSPNRRRRRGGSLTAVTDAARHAEREWSPWARVAMTRLRFRAGRRKVALVISGGGSQGSFEAGALRFLYDHVEIEPFAICGNSVGAITAAKLAEGDDPGTGRRAVEDVERIWRSLRDNSDMWEMEPWLERLRTSASWAAEVRDQIRESGSAAAQGRLVLRIVSNVVRRSPETDGAMQALRQALQADSLLSNAPVVEMCRRELHPELIAKSGILLRLGAVSLESGELRYVTENGSLVDRDNARVDGEVVSIVDGVIASSSIPLLFPPMVMNDEHYVDGGAREVLPLEMAFNHLGAEQIFAVSAGALGVPPAGSFADKGILEIARRVMTDIGPDETLRKELHPPRGWGRRVTVVAPGFDVHDALTVDPELLGVSLDYGWMRASDVLLGLDEKSVALTTSIAKTRVRLRELRGPVTGLLTPDAEELTDEEVDAERSILVPRLEEMVRQRREIGAPLPPNASGWTAPVPAPLPASPAGSA